MKFALAFAVLLLVVPARADSIQFSGDVIYLDIEPVNGQFHEGPHGLVESFQTSFDYDTISQQVSDMSFTASGLLGRHFTFTGLHSVSGQFGFTDFLWSNRQAVIDLYVPSQDFPTAGNPFAGSMIEGTKPFQLDCLTDRCQDDFGPNGFSFFDAEGRAGATFLGPSPTPEPSSLSLLGIGLLGGGFLLRRKIVKMSRI